MNFTRDGRLHIAWHLDRPVGEPVISVEDTFDGVSDASFSFYGPDKDNNQPLWLDSWNDRKTLPQLIRVRFAWHDRALDIMVSSKIGAALRP